MPLRHGALGQAVAPSTRLGSAVPRAAVHILSLPACGRPRSPSRRAAAADPSRGEASGEPPRTGPARHLDPLHACRGPAQPATAVIADLAARRSAMTSQHPACPRLPGPTLLHQQATRHLRRAAAEARRNKVRRRAAKPPPCPHPRPPRLRRPPGRPLGRHRPPTRRRASRTILGGGGGGGSCASRSLLLLPPSPPPPPPRCSSPGPSPRPPRIPNQTRARVVRGRGGKGGRGGGPFQCPP